MRSQQIRAPQPGPAQGLAQTPTANRLVVAAEQHPGYRQAVDNLGRKKTVILIAQIIYVVFGFGSGLIAVGTLALVFPDVRDVVVVLLLVVLPAELGVADRGIREGILRSLMAADAEGMETQAALRRLKQSGVAD